MVSIGMGNINKPWANKPSWYETSHYHSRELGLAVPPRIPTKAGGKTDTS